MLNDRGGGDIKRVQFSRVSWDHSLEGKTLYDWAVRRKLPPTPEGSAPLVLEGVLNGGASMVYHVIDEGDVKRIMAHPTTGVSRSPAMVFRIRARTARFRACWAGMCAMSIRSRWSRRFIK